jgi:hypothetical protein
MITSAPTLQVYEWTVRSTAAAHHLNTAHAGDSRAGLSEEAELCCSAKHVLVCCPACCSRCHH